MSQNNEFNDSSAKYNKKTQCNLDVENYSNEQFKSQINSLKEQISQMEKVISD